jgi:hypothetical protein
VKPATYILSVARLPLVVISLIFTCLLGLIGFAPTENGLLASSGVNSVLLLPSYDDVYALEFNNYWRTEVSEDFVESRYDEVLDAASLGDEFFNQFLQSKGITHVLVPATTNARSRIFHKWGERGSVNIDLKSRLFTLVETTSGPFASALYKLRESGSNSAQNVAANYSLEWSNVDWWFYRSGRSKKEVGMYAYGDHSIGYDGGEESSWFYDLSPDRSNELILHFTSKGIPKVNIRMGLIAAYGVNAPDHEVVLETNNTTKQVILTAAGTTYVDVVVDSGSEVRIKNVTPCRLPSEFEPNDESNFKICYGIGTVQVTPVTAGQ